MIIEKVKHVILGLMLLTCFITNAQAATIATRTITFVNNCSQPIWFGLAGGSAATKTGAPTCNVDSDCYAGSACIQTGSIKQCFWSNPLPANGNFQLAANGGTSQVNIPVSDENVPVIWSGVIGGRTSCTGSQCQTADCGNGSGSCVPSQGLSQPATQAEFTFSKNANDFYDVEIINGFNIPIQMSPNLTPAQLAAYQSQPYTCGSPGAAAPSNALLGACNWKFTPPSNDYRWVTAGGSKCSLDSDCAGSICGLSFNPGQSSLLQKTCGSLLGYWTADQVCGIQGDYGAPFYCGQALPAPQGNLTLWNLYACVGVDSCYQNNANSNCCGCVNWDGVGIQVPGAAYTQQCGSQNPSWLQNVEPKLQWLKAACPTAYTYPYDDMSSTFVCSNFNNSVNTVNYTITYCPAAAVIPVQQYAYNVTLGYPFLPVTINNQTKCPDVSKNPVCSITGQAANSVMTIAGTNNHICYLKINADGSLVVDNTKSVYCNVNLSSATTTAPGSIQLPGSF